MYKFTYHNSKGPIVFLHRGDSLNRVVLPSTTQSSLEKNIEDYPEKKLKRLEDKLDRYFKGEKVEFDIPINIKKLPYFYSRVLEKTREVSWGELSSYKELSISLKGNGKAARAVGQALKHNPFPLVVPCHRVVRGDGSLGGFSGGLDLKKWLLKIEGWKL